MVETDSNAFVDSWKFDESSHVAWYVLLGMDFWSSSHCLDRDPPSLLASGASSCNCTAGTRAVPSTISGLCIPCIQLRLNVYSHQLAIIKAWVWGGNDLSVAWHHRYGDHWAYLRGPSQVPRSHGASALQHRWGSMRWNQPCKPPHGYLHAHIWLWFTEECIVANQPW